MKNIIYILTILLTLTSCEKEKFDYSIYEVQVSDIDSVYFSTGSSTLIADNKASLQFIIQAFRTVKLKNEKGDLVDSVLAVDYQNLPSSEVKVYADGKLLDDMEFKIGATSANEIKFYAQIGNVRTKEKTVKIRQPKALANKRIVNVIFHVFELSSTDAAYDPLIYQPIEAKHLKEAVEYATAVFNNQYGKDPNGASANIEFRLASTTATGTKLAIPGYNLITYNSTWKTSATATSFTLANFTDKINSTVSYQWDKNKFLNIYILPFSTNSTIETGRPTFQVVPTGAVALGGISTVVNSEADVPQNKFYTNYGLGIHRTMFFPGTDRKIEIASYLGAYYGLYPTYNPNAGANSVIDYVNDTRKYLTGSTQKLNQSKNLLKVAIDGEMFIANNAMDHLNHASLRNCFTQDQVERLHLVMERSPVRKAWSQQ